MGCPLRMVHDRRACGASGAGRASRAGPVRRQGRARGADVMMAVQKCPKSGAILGISARRTSAMSVGLRSLPGPVLPRQGPQPHRSVRSRPPPCPPWEGVPRGGRTGGRRSVAAMARAGDCSVRKRGSARWAAPCRVRAACVLVQADRAFRVAPTKQMDPQSSHGQRDLAHHSPSLVLLTFAMVSPLWATLCSPMWLCGDFRIIRQMVCLYGFYGRAANSEGGGAVYTRMGRLR